MAIPKLQAYALPEASDIPANKVNWAFEPSRAALLIHDMQEYFLNFWGENSAMMEKVVANIAAGDLGKGVTLGAVGFLKSREFQNYLLQ